MRLDQICTHIVDCEHKSAPITPGGGYFAVGTPAMQGNVITYSEAREISAETFDLWTQRLKPEEGDLLFAREAPVGPVVVVPAALNIAPGQRTVLLRPNPGVADAKFLYYKISSPEVQNNIMNFAMGSTVAHMNVADVRSLDFELPSLSEQQAIAEVLGSLDDKIAANRSLATVADSLVRARYKNLSTKKSCSIEDIAENIRVQTSPNDYTMNYIGLEHIPRRHMWLDDWSDSSGVTSAKSTFQCGDVLFGKLRPYFHKVVSAPAGGISSTDILVVRAKSSELQGLVLAALSADETISRCNAFAAGTKMPRVSWNDLASCPVRWADDATMTSFSRTVMELRDRVDAAYAESRTLASLRDTLLPALMNGSLRVKDAEKQVSEVL